MTKIIRANPEQVEIEFESEEVVAYLTTRFPLEIATAKDPALKWYLESIDKLETRASVSAGQSPPIPELKLSVRAPDELESEGESDGSAGSFESIPPRPKPRNPMATSPDKGAKPKKQAGKIAPVPLSDEILNPKDVQRIIVEHVIKSEASVSSPSPKRLRSFSGRKPKPPGEVDFETWCLHVELLFQDGLSTDMQRRMILESLLSPASDLIRQLGPGSSPRDYMRLLQSAYGLVDDGEEIFAKFLNTHQDSGEKSLRVSSEITGHSQHCN